MSFIIIIVCSIWGILQWFACFKGVGIPYVSLLPNRNFIITTLKVVCMKWALVISVMGIIYGLAGLIFMKVKGGGDDSGKNLKNSFILYFYVVYSVLLLF